MYYIDTSVLAAYYCPEPLSEKAESVLTQQTQPSISAFTELELFSAISRKIREGSLSKVDGDRIVARVLSHIDGGLYHYLPVENRHYRLARDWIGNFSTALRTLDALHLAITSIEDLILVTADKALSQSAESLGVKVMLLD
jgi:uncharacterized protein